MLLITNKVHDYNIDFTNIYCEDKTIYIGNNIVIFDCNYVIFPY